MNRFSKYADHPRSRGCQGWNNEPQVVDSKVNHNSTYHKHYKDYFDKPIRQHQYVDQLKYIYKTPSNGARDYGFFNS